MAGVPVAVTAAEADALLAATRRGGFAEQTARILLLVATGLSQGQVAVDLRVDPRTVRRAVQRWRAQRLGALQDPRARTTVDLRMAANILRLPPPTGEEDWTLEALADRLGCAVSSLHEALVRSGVRWREE